MAPITVVVIDDHALILKSIRDLIAEHDDIDLVAEGTAGEHVWALVEAYQPDVLVIDLSMPMYAEGSQAVRFQAIPTLAKVRRKYPDTAIIIVSQYDNVSIVRGAAKVGVQGYLLKSDDVSLTLPTAIRTVHQGVAYLSDGIQAILASEPKPDNNKLLTQRQRQVIMAVVANPNVPYAQVAPTLHISESTFKGHINNAFQALSVGNMAACIIACMRLGIIPPQTGDDV